MSHSYSRVHVHLVFSTKERRATIPKEMQPRLWAYLAGICRNYEMPAAAIGGIGNHVHILFRLPKTVSLAKAIQILKANSSKWMGEQGVSFGWQEGYGAFSVSPSSLSRVTEYIRNQEAHHHKAGFEQEFRVLLDRHGVRYDEENVFG